MGIKSWLKYIWVGMVKNQCCHSDYSTVKLAVTQEGMNRINIF